MAEETPAPPCVLHARRCPVCCYRMPTPAHAFLHQQLHGEPGAWLEGDSVLYDRIARLMQAYKEAP